MTDWRPASGVAAARTRAAMLRRIRRHFEADRILEVDTPALSPYAVSDTQIESLAIAECAVSPRMLFLSTSPEFCMKRLLAAGYPDIFSISRVFRDGECGRRHQPEFTLVEWYRHGFGLQQIIEDSIAVINAALKRNFFAAGPVCIDYRDCFMQSVGLDPVNASVDELAGAANADSRLRKALGGHRDDWLDLILATRIVPSFPGDRLTVLQHYPATQAALARLCPDDPGVADRFEIFFGAIELANGYVELTDAAEQLHRMRTDDEERQRRGRTLRPNDRSLLAALESGLPDCAGVAMGLERLQMIHDKTDDIRDVVSFTFEVSV